MRKRDPLITILILCLALITSCSILNPAMKFTTEQKEEDFLYLYNVMKSDYPLFGVKDRIYKVNWLNKKDEYLKTIVETESDEEFYTKLYYIVQELYDGHTHIVSPQYYRLLNSFMPQNVVKYPSTINEFFVKPYKIAEESYNYWNEILNDDSQESTNTETNTIKNVSFNTYHNGDTAYIRFSSFMASIEECEAVSSFIRDHAKCSNLIIDIRNNYGGSEAQWTNYIVKPLINKEYEIEKRWAFRHGPNSQKFMDIALKSMENVTKNNITELALEDYPPELATDFSDYLTVKTTYKPTENSGFKGKIYLLVNRGVYSAAESFASFCKQTGFATLVGERTLGDGSGSAPILVKLPNSGLLLRMRLQMILNPNGTANAEYGTSPDIEAYSLEALNETLKIIEENRKP